MPVFQQVASFLSFKHQFAAKQFVNLQNEGQRNGIDLPRHRNKTHLKLNHPKHVGIQRHWECMCIWIYTNYSTGDWEGDISSSDQVSTCPYCWSLWPLCLNVHLYLQYIVCLLFVSSLRHYWSRYQYHHHYQSGLFIQLELTWVVLFMKRTHLCRHPFQGSMILFICNCSWNKSAQAPPCHQWPRFPRNENRHDVLRFRPKNRCFEWCLWLTCWPWCHLFAHVMNVSWCIMGPTCSKPIPLFYPFMKSPIPRWL